MKLFIDTNWYDMIQDLPQEKQIEIMRAVFAFPNGDSDTHIWKKVIKPQLEQSAKLYKEKYERFAENRKKRWQQKSEQISDQKSEQISNRYQNVNVKDNNNTRKESSKESTTRAHNALEVFGNSFKATDAVVDIFDRPDGTTREGIRIKNPRLMAFVRQRFDSNVLSKVSDWAIDHNQRGHTYNATSLLKLLCKFQSNVEPTINFNSVQAEYLTFEYKQPQK
ncbi:MAG: hypothetical protein II238_00515 [Alphaproteobacteria bacterium]|nr:hypothetical protein [Alphaproteobacteria bacterium]